LAREKRGSAADCGSNQPLVDNPQAARDVLRNLLQYAYRDRENQLLRLYAHDLRGDVLAS